MILVRPLVLSGAVQSPGTQPYPKPAKKKKKSTIEMQIPSHIKPLPSMMNFSYHIFPKGVPVCISAIGMVSQAF